MVYNFYELEEMVEQGFIANLHCNILLLEKYS